MPKVVIEVNNQKESFSGKLANHDWVKSLTLVEACIIRYLFVNIKNEFDEKSLIDSLI